MTRKIDDAAIKAPDLQIKAQITDTYVRPAAAPEGELEQLARSLVNVQPSIAKYLHTKQEEKDDFEIEQGMELYKNCLADGEDLTADEIGQKIQAGDLDGFRKLTRMQKQGIYQARHKMLGLNLQKHMSTWSEGATLEDENGNAVPLAQVKDQERVMTAFAQEQARWVKEVTGGKYDPVLYQEYVSSAENSAVNTFIQKQVAARVEQIQTEQIRTASGILDGLVMPFVKNGSLLADPDTAIPQLTETLNMEAIAMKQRGIRETDAMKIMSQYLQTAMRNVPEDNIQALLKAAQTMPMLQNPAIQETLKQTATDAEEDAQRKRWRDKQARQDKVQEEAFDLYKNMWENGENKQAVEAFLKKYPEAAAEYNSIKKSMDIARSSTGEMDNDTFRDVRIQALRGQLNYSGVMHLLPSLSPDQQDDLVGIAMRNESRIRSITAENRAATRASAGAAIDKTYKSLEKVLRTYTTDNPQLKGLTTEQKRGYAALQNRIVELSMYEYEAWKQDAKGGAAQDYGKCEAAKASIVGRIYGQYEKQLMTYIDNPAKLNEDPETVAHEADTAALARFRSGLKPKAQQEFFAKASGDTKEFAIWLKKQGVQQPEAKAKRLQEQLKNMK